MRDLVDELSNFYESERLSYHIFLNVNPLITTLFLEEF
jgi:hypothetical protein